MILTFISKLRLANNDYNEDDDSIFLKSIYPFTYLLFFYNKNTIDGEIPEYQ